MPSKKSSGARTRRSTSQTGSVLRGLVTFALTSFALLYILIAYDPFGLSPAPAANPTAQVSVLGSPTVAASSTPFLPITDTPAPPVTLAPENTRQPSTSAVSATPPGATPALTSVVPAASPLAPTSAPNWWEVYFSNPNTLNNPDQLSGSIPERLIQYINAAQISIDVAVFEFDLTPVAEALIAAHRRGVVVRWITDDEYGLGADEEPGNGQFAMLASAGIPIVTDERSALMHNKFIIFDSRIVWTGSTNLTVNDNFLNNNNVIVIQSPELATVYETQFAEMWQGEFGQRSPSNIAAQAVMVKRTPVQVLFSPEDNAIPFLIPLVEAAQESIHFMAFSFTHDDLTDAMLARARAGVDVRGIFETRGSQTLYSALGSLFCAQLPVRQDGNPRTFHHKVIIIDERLLITGSLNLSDNANEPNNENSLVISSRTISDRYLREFERRWAEARPPNPTNFACP